MRPPRASKTMAGEKMLKEMKEEKELLKKRKNRSKKSSRFEEDEDVEMHDNDIHIEQSPIKKQKSNSSTTSTNKKSSQSGGSFELLKLPKPCLEIIIGNLDSKSILSLICTSKQFNFIKSNRAISMRILSKFIKKSKSQQSIFTEWCHEAYLGGWLADCYSSFISVCHYFSLFFIIFLFVFTHFFFFSII